MPGVMMPVVGLRAVDTNGEPLNGAQLQFYLSGTTTPTPVYTDQSLATPLTNPVHSDSAGLFPPIFYDPTITYRAQLQTSAGALIFDVDPVAQPTVIAAGAVTGAMLAAGAVVANLGYTPVNKAGDTATNLLLSSTTAASNSAGYLGAPRNEQDASYVLALSDAGSLVRCNSGAASAYTIPPISAVAWPIGTTIVFRNYGAGVLTITRGSTVQLLIAGSGTSQDVQIAQHGFATLMSEDLNAWVITGVGLS